MSTATVTAPKTKPCACCHCAHPAANNVCCLVCGKAHLTSVTLNSGRVEWLCKGCRHVNVITETGHAVGSTQLQEGR